MPLLSLTTDFGTCDWFVGSMKGIILGIAPRATIVDLTHDIPPGDIAAGAFVLAAACRDFPHGTIHVAVVDPGVGGRRAAIAVKTRHFWFVGPDNSLLSLALANESIVEIRRIENEKLFRHPVSRTFHGRDIFAPVAAHLARGLKPSAIGPKISEFQKLPCTEARRVGNEIRGAVVYVDRFGNAITNIRGADLPSVRVRVTARGKNIGPLRDFYEQVPNGKPLAIQGSSGHLEIAVNGGSAAKTLRLKIGDSVTLQHAS